MSESGFGRRAILYSAAAAFLAFAASVLGQTPAGTSAATPAAKPGGAKKQGAAAKKEEWPKKVPFGEATLVLEEPRAERLEGTKLTSHGAFRIERGQSQEPLAGTASYVSDVQIDRANRMVTIAVTEVPKVDLPGAPQARQERVAERIAMVFNRQQPKISLDGVLATLKMAKSPGGAPPKLNNDPPKILFETEPAILLVFDGEPRFHAVEGTKLERAQNTPFLVLRASGGACYLNGGTTWFRADDPKGPWTKAETVPTEAVQVAQRDLKDGGVSDADVKKGASEVTDKRVPKILVATDPTELIVSEGPPKWTPAVSGELDALSSSESDVFRTPSDNEIYVLLSGRWFRSASFEGPWTYVEPDHLPASFRRIPSDSPKADALASVPGTAMAAEALADAEKPRTAAVKRSEAHAKVTYDGDPKFESVAGTKVEYAVNTPDQVLKIRGAYYVCDQGVWFTANSATGPWTVADAIPEDEIQTIPADSSVYNTRYATIYDSTPDLVYMAYTPAYLGSYPYYGTVVFGTGWFYRPWWGAYYYPRFWTWGFHARYWPWAGWGYGFGWGPAWAGFRWGFGWGWGARWCGPAGFFRPAWRNVNITRNVSINRNVTRNVYNTGANRTRTVGARGATSAASASKQGSGKGAQGKQAAGKSAQGKGTHSAAGAQKGKTAGAHAGGAKGGAGHAGGHAGGHGGGHGKK